MTNVITFLRGKKTYFAAAIAALYLAGVYLEFWTFDEKVLAAIGITALATLRSAIPKGPALAALSAFQLFSFSASLLLLCFLTTGCKTALNSNKIISETSWGVGLFLETTAPAEGTVLPKVKLGVVRQTITLIPTATNQVFAPRFGSAYAGKQSPWDPIACDAQESVFSGDVMISTNATGSAVVPKLKP
jgi:hypothetical protein